MATTNHSEATPVFDEEKFRAEAAAEREKAQAGFEPFSWLSTAAEAKHGPAMTDAFNLAQDMLHGTSTLLEMLEDEQLVEQDRGLGKFRTGNVTRFLVAATSLAAERLSTLLDDINVVAAPTLAKASTDFDSRR